MKLDQTIKRRIAGSTVLLLAGLTAFSIVMSAHAGLLGRWVGEVLADVFGRTALLVPLFAFAVGLRFFSKPDSAFFPQKVSGYLLLFLSVETLLGSLPEPHASDWAGETGGFLSSFLGRYIGLPGVLMVGAFAGLVGLWLSRNEALLAFAVRVTYRFFSWLASVLASAFRKTAGYLKSLFRRRSVQMISPSAQKAPEIPAEPRKPLKDPPPVTVNIPAPHDPAGAESSSVEKAAKKEVRAAKPPKPTPGKIAWQIPPAGILEKEAVITGEAAIQGYVKESAKVIEESLGAFHVSGRVVSATVGARVILFEWQPAPGEKASHVSQLSHDLALSLKVERVRVVYPLPGKGTIGIEIPHPSPAEVTLGGMLVTHRDPGSMGKLPLFLGRSLTGENLVADLCEMPHLLIAGTTGSGKSVCIHTILMSLLMTRTPDDLRLLLIDPKRVELLVYRRCPHLLSDVVTDAKRAVAVLRWLEKVMDARYGLLAQFGCRNLSAFNEMVASEGLPPEGELTKGALVGAGGLPWIVVAVDELADLMATRPQEVENSLYRLAQMSRGVGIHLVLATQRPSVDVLTGVIKANMPSRIAFQVATRVDSRTILDEGGAEQLLGRGDMLYSPVGAASSVRAQGAFVGAKEIARVVEAWRTQGSLGWETTEDKTEGPEGIDTSEDDPLYSEAVDLVLKTGEASVSMLQRRLSIGFARAGRLVDMMEARGVVGPKQGSKAREIIVERPGAEDN